MNNIEQFLFENPEAVQVFEEENRDILQMIKDRFDKLFNEGDVVGKFLLCVALQEIIRVNAERQRDLCMKEIQRRGFGIMEGNETAQ